MSGGSRLHLTDSQRSIHSPNHVDLRQSTLPAFSRKSFAVECAGDKGPPERWYEPRDERVKMVRFIREEPGKSFVHGVTIPEIKDYLQALPPALHEQIVLAVDVIRLSGRTRRNENRTAGLQWGTAVYLYPVDESLTETFIKYPTLAHRNETERYGGRWNLEGSGKYQLTWTRESLRDYYLCEILMHEIGHVLDTRNTSFAARERFANSFATEFGYRPWKARQPARQPVRRHDRLMAER